MVTPYEIVLELDNSFSTVRVILFEKQQELGLHSCLIVILLLVLDHFDCNVLVLLVIPAFDNLAESSLSNKLSHFEAVANLITCHDSVVPLRIVEAVIHEPLLLCGLVLLICLCKIKHFFILLNLSQFVHAQVFLRFWI